MSLLHIANTASLFDQRLYGTDCKDILEANQENDVIRVRQAQVLAAQAARIAHVTESRISQEDVDRITSLLTDVRLVPKLAKAVQICLMYDLGKPDDVMGYEWETTSLSGEWSQFDFEADMNVYLTKSMIYLDRGEAESALEFAYRAKTIASQLGTINKESKAQNLITQVYASMGQVVKESETNVEDQKRGLMLTQLAKGDYKGAYLTIATTEQHAYIQLAKALNMKECYYVGESPVGKTAMLVSNLLKQKYHSQAIKFKSSHQRLSQYGSIFRAVSQMKRGMHNSAVQLIGVEPQALDLKVLWNVCRMSIAMRNKENMLDTFIHQLNESVKNIDTYGPLRLMFNLFPNELFAVVKMGKAYHVIENFSDELPKLTEKWLYIGGQEHKITFSRKMVSAAREQRPAYGDISGVRSFHREMKALGVLNYINDGEVDFLLDS